VATAGRTPAVPPRPRLGRHGLGDNSLGGVEVVLEQHGRDGQHGRQDCRIPGPVVGGNSSACRNRSEEFANGVAVFDPVEPADGDVSWIGPRGGSRPKPSRLIQVTSLAIGLGRQAGSSAGGMMPVRTFFNTRSQRAWSRTAASVSNHRAKRRPFVPETMASPCSIDPARLEVARELATVAPRRAGSPGARGRAAA